MDPEESRTFVGNVTLVGKVGVRKRGNRFMTDIKNLLCESVYGRT